MNRGKLESMLMEIHQQSFGWAIACCQRDKELALEVLQDAYLKVLQGKAKYDGR